MEKKIIFFIALLLCATNALAEDIDTTMFTEFGFKGKVKTVTCFYSKEDFGDIVKDKDAIYSFSYDNLGNLKETRSGGYNCVSRYYIYEGNKLTQILISHLGYIDSTIKSYNLTDSISLKYDDKGNLVEKEFFSIKYYYVERVDVIKYEVIKYKYNASNRITEKNEYRADGTLRYRTIYNYNAKGQLERKQRFDYWGDVGYEYDSSFVFGASGKIIRDSCNYYQDSYNKIIRQVAHKYSYDENGRLKKVDYEFYTNNWWPEKGVKKTQILPKRKTEYTYNASGSVSVVKEFKYDYLFPGLLNLKEPDKLNGVYKTKETNFLYNNGKRIQIIVTFYDRVDYLSKSLEIKPTEKVLYNCDMYGNWTEKRVFVIKDGIEFFKEGVIREISYYE